METKTATEKQISEWRAFFQENGYLVIPHLVSRDSVQTLKNRIEELTDKFFDSDDFRKYVSVFTTGENKQTGDQYFLRSGDNISFFFEEDALDKTGTLKVERNRAMNKVGHALDTDDCFRNFTNQPAVTQLLPIFQLKEPILTQSMYIFKQPKIGGKVTIHQDSTFINTKPMTCYGLWFALDDVSQENGCLWVVPGSHKHGICSRWKLKEDKITTYFTEADKDERAPWSSLDEEFSKEKYPEKWIPVTLEAGGIVLLHGSLVHMSEKNTSNKPRHAYTLHVVDKHADYSPENWLQIPNTSPLATQYPNLPAHHNSGFRPFASTH